MILAPAVSDVLQPLIEIYPSLLEYSLKPMKRGKTFLDGWPCRFFQQGALCRALVGFLSETLRLS